MDDLRDAREWVSGAAISFEWRGDNSVDRRRWYAPARAEKLHAGVAGELRISY